MFKVKVKIFYKEGSENRQKDVYIQVPLSKEEIKEGINRIVKKRYLPIIIEENNLERTKIERFIVDISKIETIKDGDSFLEKSLKDMDLKELQLYVINKKLSGVRTYMANSREEIIRQINLAEERKKREEKNEEVKNSPLSRMSVEEIEELKKQVKNDYIKEFEDLKKSLKEELINEMASQQGNHTN